MAVNEFSKYIITGKDGSLSSDQDGVKTAGLVGPDGWCGIEPRIGWKYVAKPGMVMSEPHSHDYEEFLIFLGDDPAEPQNLNAEIEISFGAEGEKHLITGPACVCLPKGLVHGPVNFRKVDKPVVFAQIRLAAEAVMKPATISGKTETIHNDSKYGKYIIPGPTEARPLVTEKWGVRINEETTAKAGKFDGNFNFLSILGSHVLPDPPHDHGFDEFLFLIPAKADNWPALGGEVELGLGEDWKRQYIDTAAVICLPPHLQHCPVFMKSVETPFYWGHFLPVSAYASSEFDPEANIE